MSSECKLRAATTVGTKCVGLGDVAYRVFKALGINWYVKQMGYDCGCEDRRTRWNNWKVCFPSKKAS